MPGKKTANSVFVLRISLKNPALKVALKQLHKIYQCLARQSLLCYSETWKLPVAGDLGLCEVECRMIRMTCKVKLVGRISINVL